MINTSSVKPFFMKNLLIFNKTIAKEDSKLGQVAERPLTAGD
ncbi:hypothetical protein [Sporomusa sp. KB1]|jgi:hypothetical protein|nr:hypothetical protein [Sporomusa sp. KB1]